MPSLRTIGILALFFCLLAPIQCRRADGGSGDPVEREARTRWFRTCASIRPIRPASETSGARFLQQLSAQGWHRREVDRLRSETAVGLCAPRLRIE